MMKETVTNLSVIFDIMTISSICTEYKILNTITNTNKHASDDFKMSEGLKWEAVMYNVTFSHLVCLRSV